MWGKFGGELLGEMQKKGWNNGAKGFFRGVVYRVLGCEIYNHLMEDILTP